MNMREREREREERLTLSWTSRLVWMETKYWITLLWPYLHPVCRQASPSWEKQKQNKQKAKT